MNSVRFYYILAVVGNEPGLVETRTVQIVPQSESELLRTETIRIIPPQVQTNQSERNCVITTHTLPTEVITKTITIEGDTSSMSPEELQKLIEDSADGEVETSTMTTTQVVRVSYLPFSYVCCLIQLFLSFDL